VDYKETAKKIVIDYISDRPIEGGDVNLSDMLVEFGSTITKDINGTIFDISFQADAQMFNYRSATYDSPVEYSLSSYGISSEVVVYDKDGEEIDYFELEFDY